MKVRNTTPESQRKYGEGEFIEVAGTNETLAQILAKPFPSHLLPPNQQDKFGAQSSNVAHNYEPEPFHVEPVGAQGPGVVRE